MKKIIYGALLGIILSLFIMNIGAVTKGAPCFAYVFSDSMEPTIKINDAFLVWPSKNWKPGDIVLYRPVKLDAALITHRIIAIGENGFITKGDNSPSIDQQAGEPELKTERIVGKIVTFQGKPVIIPGLGNLLGSMKNQFGLYTKLLAGGLIAIGIMLALWELFFPHRKRKTRNRWRLGDLYRVVSVLSVGLVILGVLLGSRVNQVKYLVSVNPGTQENHIRINETGRMTIQLKNVGILPVWHLSAGIKPIEIQKAPEIIWPWNEESIIISIPPQHEVGWYYGYIRIYNYPLILPRTILVYLHNISPFLALAGVGIALYIWLYLFIKMINRLESTAEWIPLRALKNKVYNRRYQRIISKILKQRRSRK